MALFHTLDYRRHVGITTLILPTHTNTYIEYTYLPMYLGMSGCDTRPFVPYIYIYINYTDTNKYLYIFGKSIIYVCHNKHICKELKSI